MNTPAISESVPAEHQRFPSEEEDLQGGIHFVLCAHFVIALRELFQNDTDTNIGGDQAFYWNRNDDRYNIVPDAYLIRGCGNELRQSFLLWEEKAAYPNFSIRFALEVWSPGNSQAERDTKRQQYQSLDVIEFFELTPLTGNLIGSRLINGRYEPIERNENGRLFSEELQAELAVEEKFIRLYRNGQKILTAPEQAELIAAQQAVLNAKDAILAAKEAEIDRLKKLLGDAGK